jgi:phosphoadenosine phosphosulfate reductase
MYSYTYDAKTGGLVLNSSPTQFSKEPRPVYSKELDLLGFNNYWKYEKRDDVPYMWAEANMYWYKGKLVAKLRGGNLYITPEIEFLTDENRKIITPEADGGTLQPIDIDSMLEANKELLGIVEQTTVKKILAIYDKYKNKLDLFHVAFSGGKDSMVLLDLVKKILPKGSFVVVFGDTGMEFPDTYEAVQKTKLLCEKEEIPFYTARSHLDPKESWKLFGPPSRVLRWCCSVHKSTPQTLKLREVTGNTNYTGLAFVGVRAHESAARAEYEYENYGKKQKGQFSHNSILEWTSAEIWLYIYANNLSINEAYKRGNSRAGCLLCPMGGGKSDCIRNLSYNTEIKEFTEIIKTMVNENSIIDFESYIANSGWEARSSGRDLINNPTKYKEEINGDKLQIIITHPTTDWHEWIKTIGEIPFDYKVEENKDGYSVFIPLIVDKTTDAKLFKQVFRKAAYCVGCRVCEANCRHRCISFEKGLYITNCIKCGQCHTMPYGCYVADCLKKPLEEKRMKSLNTFEEHAPKPEWISDFFDRKEQFLQENQLGPNQKTKFRRFLSDAELIKKNEVTKFTELVCKIGWDSESAWGLILINLVYNNPQMKWYIDNFDIGIVKQKKTVENTLVDLELSEKMARAIIASYKRIVETTLGTVLHFGYVTEEGDLVRTKCIVSDPRVLLYGLFKFAEKCGDYREFTLATLLNDSIERDGISPTQIFGLERDDMVPMLLGLSAKYPDFINATFTNDLEKITIKEGKDSEDVLGLFKEEGENG